jgi:hypothetical protein
VGVPDPVDPEQLARFRKKAARQALRKRAFVKAKNAREARARAFSETKYQGDSTCWKQAE